MKRLIAMTLASVFAMGAVFWASTGDAEARRWRKRRGGCMKMLMRAPGSKLKNKLGMTDAQVTKLKQLRASFVNQAIPLRAKIKLQRFQIRQLMDNNPVDQAKVLAAVGQMNTLKGKMRLLAVKKRLQMKTLITPQQRQKIRKMCRRYKRMRRMRRWRGHRFHRRHGRRFGRRHGRRFGRRWHRKHRGGHWHHKSKGNGPSTQPAPKL